MSIRGVSFTQRAPRMSPRPFFSLRFHPVVLSALLTLHGVAGAAPLTPEKTTVTGGTLTLEQAYDRALATDQTIRIAYWEIRKANLLPWSALARIGPQITANGSYTRSSFATRNTVIETTSTLVNG